MLTVKRRFELLFLVLELSCRAAVEVCERLAERLRLLPRALEKVAFGVKAVEQRGKRRCSFLRDKTFILANRHTGKVPRLFLTQQNRRRFFAGVQRLQLRKKPTCGLPLFFVRHGGQIKIDLTEHAEGKLPAKKGRETSEIVQQKRVRRLLRFLRNKQRAQLVLGCFPRVALSLRGRQMVVKPRQNLPLLGHLKIDPAQAIENPPVRARQDEVRVAPHEL